MFDSIRWRPYHLGVCTQDQCCVWLCEVWGSLPQCACERVHTRSKHTSAFSFPSHIWSQVPPPHIPIPMPQPPPPVACNRSQIVFEVLRFGLRLLVNRATCSETLIIGRRFQEGESLVNLSFLLRLPFLFFCFLSTLPLGFCLQTTGLSPLPGS